MPALYPDAISADLIRTHSHELASIADVASLDAAVPTCGDWTLADLVRHLMDVQSFWAFIIENRPVGPDSYEVGPRSRRLVL